MQILKNKLKGVRNKPKLKTSRYKENFEKVCKALFESYLAMVLFIAISFSKCSDYKVGAPKIMQELRCKDEYSCKLLKFKPVIFFNQGVMTYNILHVHCLCYRTLERSMNFEHGRRNLRDM